MKKKKNKPMTEAAFKRELRRVIESALPARREPKHKTWRAIAEQALYLLGAAPHMMRPEKLAELRRELDEDAEALRRAKGRS